jgi:hypothetical protein
MVWIYCSPIAVWDGDLLLTLGDYYLPLRLLENTMYIVYIHEEWILSCEYLREFQKKS